MTTGICHFGECCWQISNKMKPVSYILKRVVKSLHGDLDSCYAMSSASLRTVRKQICDNHYFVLNTQTVQQMETQCYKFEGTQLVVVKNGNISPVSKDSLFPNSCNMGRRPWTHYQTKMFDFHFWWRVPAYNAFSPEIQKIYVYETDINICIL